MNYWRRVGDVRAARRVGRYVVGTCWCLWKRSGGGYRELLCQSDNFVGAYYLSCSLGYLRNASRNTETY